MASSEEAQENPITVPEIKAVAKKRLDPAVWDYYTAAADGKRSARRNAQAFES